MSRAESNVRVGAETFTPEPQGHQFKVKNGMTYYTPMYPGKDVQVEIESQSAGPPSAPAAHNTAVEDGVRSGVTGMIPPLPTDNEAFQTTYLTYDTTRDPFNHQPYLEAIEPTVRFRLNLGAVLGQAVLLVLLPTVAVLVANRMQSACIYRENEMEKMQLYDYTDKVRSLAYVHVKNKDVTRFPRPDKARTGDICSLLVDASLQERESLIRDYMGPFVTRRFNTDQKRRCGYFNKPDDIGSGQNKWKSVYTKVNTRGFHYGATPALTNKKTKEQYTYVCVMDPIGIAVLGTEYIVEYLSLIGIFMFIIAYLFGPGAHNDKCFTIAIIGTVMVSGMGVAMATVLLTALYVYSLKFVVRKVYTKEIAATELEITRRKELRAAHGTCPPAA